MSKTFTRAGISTDAKGKTRFRFTNDGRREIVLARAGHTNITFYDLTAPMSKEAAREALHEAGHREGQVELAPVVEDVADDGFVEPTDERVQVLMCQLARTSRGAEMSAHQLRDTVYAEYGV